MHSGYFKSELLNDLRILLFGRHFVGSGCVVSESVIFYCGCLCLEASLFALHCFIRLLECVSVVTVTTTYSVYIYPCPMHVNVLNIIIFFPFYLSLSTSSNMVYRAFLP